MLSTSGRPAWTGRVKLSSRRAITLVALDSANSVLLRIRAAGSADYQFVKPSGAAPQPGSAGRLVLPSLSPVDVGVRHRKSRVEENAIEVSR